MVSNRFSEMPIENISIKNMVVTGAKEGIVVNKVAKLNIENVEIDTPDQSMIQIENTTGITINGKELGNISEKRLLTKN